MKHSQVLLGIDVSSQNSDGMNTQAIDNNSEDSNVEFFVTAADQGMINCLTHYKYLKYSQVLLDEDVIIQNADGTNTKAISNNSEDFRSMWIENTEDQGNNKLFYLTKNFTDCSQILLSVSVICQIPDGTNTRAVPYLIQNESRDRKDESVAPSLTQASTSQPTLALIPPPHLDSVFVVPSATEHPLTISFPTAPYPYLIQNESRDRKDKSVAPSRTRASASHKFYDQLSYCTFYYSLKYSSFF